MDCKTIAEDKNKIFYTYFNTLDIILANVLNRFSSIHNLNGNKFYITILLVPSLEQKINYTFHLAKLNDWHQMGNSFPTTHEKEDNEINQTLYIYWLG